METLQEDVIETGFVSEEPVKKSTGIWVNVEVEQARRINVEGLIVFLRSAVIDSCPDGRAFLASRPSR